MFNLVMLKKVLFRIFVWFYQNFNVGYWHSKLESEHHFSNNTNLFHHASRLISKYIKTSKLNCPKTISSLFKLETYLIQTSHFY